MNLVYANLLKKILPPEGFAAKSKQLRAESKKTVFTNGCFDLLHNGHIQYLAEAKAQGDFLFLALNSDASVARLKGPKRPIFPLQERLENLAALQMVDWLTWFEEDTPLSIITAAEPCVLVKGGDYTPETIIGKELVERLGGVVQNLLFVGGRSTSQVLDSWSKK